MHERNNHVWDQWKIDEDGIYRIYDNKTGKLLSEKEYGKEFAGTIGTAYGWIVNKYKLIDQLLDKLKNNQTDRRMVMSLWQDEWLKTAVLPSCVWSSEWDVTDGKLNAWVHQRSADVPLGLPFNVTQYSVLLNLLAKVTNLTPGTLDWSIKDAHIYENQIPGIKEQINREEFYDSIKKYDKNILKEIRRDILKGSSIRKKLDIETAKDIVDFKLLNQNPYLWINPDVEDFYSFDNSKDLKDIKIKNYTSMGKIKFPIAQ